MAAGLEPGLVTRRTPVPSAREAEHGAVAPAVFTAGVGEEKPRLRAPLRELVLDADPRRIRAGQPLKPVVVIAFIGFFKQFANLVLQVSYGYILLDLAISDNKFRSLSLAFAVVGIFATLGTSYLSDRVPRLWVLVGGSLVLGIATVVGGSHKAFWAFVIVALANTIFASLGFALPIEMSLYSDWYPPESRGRVMAFSGSLALLLQAVLSVAAGVFVRQFGWTHAIFITGIVILAVSPLYLVLREPARGHWDRLRLGASEDVAARTLPKPKFGETLRMVRSVRTLRRVCLANMWLSATGEFLLPILILLSVRAAGGNAILVGVIIAGQRLMTLLGLETGGVLADRVLSKRPGAVLPLMGWVLVLNMCFLAFYGLVRIPWIVVPALMCQAFVGQIPTIAQNTITSLVTPANIRTFGVSIPSLYGLVGMLVVLPFAFVVSGAGVVLVAAACGAVGAVIYLSGAADVERDIKTARLAVLAEQDTADAAAAGQNKLLVARGVDVEYDGVQVLFGVDLDIDDGELVALLGTNGAGKSTLLRAISGLSEPSGGAIFLAGRDTTHALPHELAQLGVVSMPGGRGVFPTLSVADNLRAAAWSLSRDEASQRIAAAYEFFPALKQRRDILAGNLSGGEQQMVALSQAMIMKPRLLLVDELSLGLAPAVIEQLLQALVRIHEGGTTVILVEQSVDLALSVARRAVFMEKGEIRFDGSAAELRQRPELLRSVYIRGTRQSSATRATARRRTMAAGTTVLEVSDLTVSYGGVVALDGASLRVNAGEIVGLIGPNGAGKTTLFDAICGFAEPVSGRVAVAGRDVSAATPSDRSALGLARSFQDARLFPALTVRENVQLALHRHAGRDTAAALAALWLPQARRAEAKLRRRADGILESIGLLADADKVPAELSTGMRRVLDLGCMMAAQPDVLLLDEPSTGIAQAEAEELGPLLDRIRSDLGCGMLVIEHDMSLLTSVADRMVGMVLGRTIVDGSVDDVTSDARMVAAYLGTSERVLARSGVAHVGGALVTSTSTPEAQT